MRVSGTSNGLYAVKLSESRKETNMPRHNCFRIAIALVAALWFSAAEGQVIVIKAGKLVDPETATTLDVRKNRVLQGSWGWLVRTCVSFVGACPCGANSPGIVSAFRCCSLTSFISSS